MQTTAESGKRNPRRAELFSLKRHERTHGKLTRKCLPDGSTRFYRGGHLVLTLSAPREIGAIDHVPTAEREEALANIRPAPKAYAKRAAAMRLEAPRRYLPLRAVRRTSVAARARAPRRTRRASAVRRVARAGPKASDPPAPEPPRPSAVAPGGAP